MNAGADETLRMLINKMVGQIPMALNALLMSLDGLVVARTDSLAEDDADRLAAAEAMIWATATAIGAHSAAGPAEQVIVRFADRWLFVGLAAPGTCISVMVDGQADPQVVGFQMERLVGAVAEHLLTAPRALAAAGGAAIGPPRS